MLSIGNELRKAKEQRGLAPYPRYLVGNTRITYEFHVG